MQIDKVIARQRRSKKEILAQVFWLTWILIIYSYLYLLVCLGGPFAAFDHENYINFLNDPYPFFFEPLYTAIAYISNWILPEDKRFALVFILFTLPPLLITWRYSRKKGAHPSSVLAYACVLIKSFYIGFIAQRFFFAELWVAAALITSAPKSFNFIRNFIPGTIHFSALTLVPTNLWINTRYSWKKFSIALALVLSAYVYIKLFSSFELFGYSYARYLENDNLTDGFPFMSLVQMTTLATMCWFFADHRWRMNLVGLCALIFITKLLFSDIEVFSRIIQLQTDIIIVVAILSGCKAPALLFLYCTGFMLLQIFFTPTASEMAAHHILALKNLWQAI